MIKSWHIMPIGKVEIQEKGPTDTMKIGYYHSAYLYSKMQEKIKPGEISDALKAREIRW